MLVSSVLAASEAAEKQAPAAAGRREGTGIPPVLTADGIDIPDAVSQLIALAIENRSLDPSPAPTPIVRPGVPAVTTVPLPRIPARQTQLRGRRRGARIEPFGTLTLQ